jgi:opacity protein-like surface antigen
MKRILTGVLALALVGYLGCGANAAEMVAQGAERVAVVGSADYTSMYGDEDATSLSFGVAGEYGYMILDQLELAVRASVALQHFQYQTPETDNKYNYRSQDYSLDLVPKWRPALEGNISPFIGPKLGVRYITESEAYTDFHDNANDAMIEWGVVLGADIFLGKDVALVVEYDYTQFTMHTGFDESPGLPVKQFGVQGGFWQGHDTIKDNALTVGLAYWW